MVKIKGENKHLGNFDTVEEAHATYRFAKAREILTHGLMDAAPAAVKRTLLHLAHNMVDEFLPTA